MHVESVYEEKHVSIAKKLPLSAWLVSEHDVNEIRKDLVIEVKKIREYKALSSKKTELLSI
jgi:hypothetical protein